MARYLFLNNVNCGFNHISFIMGTGDLSSFHIEIIWSYLKSSIRRIYYYIPNNELYYYLKESEFRYLNNNKSKN